MEVGGEALAELCPESTTSLEVMVKGVDEKEVRLSALKRGHGHLGQLPPEAQPPAALPVHAPRSRAPVSVSLALRDC